MSQAISRVPCLGTSQPYFYSDPVYPPFLDTKTKVVLLVSTLFVVVGFCLLPQLPLLGGLCLSVAIIGSIFQIIKRSSEQSAEASRLKEIAKLDAAKQLAGNIAISPTLYQELEKIIPAIDAMENDSRIGMIHYNCDKTTTFTLKSSPDLQFRISPPYRLGCDEFRLARRYENLVHAHTICQSEKYDSLLVPSIKPLHLTVGGFQRALLVEKTVEKAKLSVKNLNLPVRQMVRFLLKTGGSSSYDPIPFIPLKGNKLSLQNLHNLTDNPHPRASTCDFLKVERILGKSNSLLSSLDQEEIMDIALDELLKLRPTNSRLAQISIERATREVLRDKEERMNQIQRSAPVHVRSTSAPPPNLLGVSPEDLGLNLTLKDYAVIKHDGVYSDGITRIITLKEVAQAVIDRIHQKLEADPQNPNIEFTPEDMLIGETIPSFAWEDHYQYNLLRGLGNREWPDPNQEPPSWMSLILQSLKDKNLVVDFALPKRENPRLRINNSRS